jgi:hypothetical protein
MVLVQVGEQDGGKVRRAHPGGGKSVAQQANQGLDAGAVAQEAGSKSGVDDGGPRSLFR